MHATAGDAAGTRGVAAPAEVAGEDVRGCARGGALGFGEWVSGALGAGCGALRRGYGPLVLGSGVLLVFVVVQTVGSIAVGRDFGGAWGTVFRLVMECCCTGPVAVGVYAAALGAGRGQARYPQ